MINRKSESIKLLESIQTAMKEDKARKEGLTQEEINQIKNSLNDNFYKIFELEDNNDRGNQYLDILIKDTKKVGGYIKYDEGSIYFETPWRAELDATPGYDVAPHIEANTLQEMVQWVNKLVDAHVNANLPSAKEFEQYLSEKALKIINNIEIINHSGWKYITSPYKAFEEYGFTFTLDPNEDNKLFVICICRRTLIQKDTFNTWQEAVQWINKIIDNRYDKYLKFIDNSDFYYDNDKDDYDDEADEENDYDDEEDEENETLYDLVAVYDKNKKILFYKKFEVGEEEPYLLQFDEVKEAISFAENNPAAEVAILWDGIRDGESYDVEIWNSVEGDISDSPEDEEADYDYYTAETKKLLED